MKKSYLENIGETPVDGKSDKNKQKARRLRYIIYVRACKLVSHNFMARGEFEFAKKIRVKQKF